MTEHMWERSYVPSDPWNMRVRQSACSCGWEGPIRHRELWPARDDTHMFDFLRHLADSGTPEPLAAYQASKGFVDCS